MQFVFMDTEFQCLFIFYLRRHDNGIGSFGGGFERQAIIELVGKKVGSGLVAHFVVDQGPVGTQYKRFFTNQRKKKEQSV